jgi:hypothetical protein
MLICLDMRNGRIPVWLKRWGPALIWMVIIFVFSATPSRELPNFGSSDTLVRKTAHMLEYAFLALVYVRGAAGGLAPRHTAWKYLIFSLFLVALYAITDEAHQSFVPGRNPRWVDVGIDTVGGAVGMILWKVVPGVRGAVAFLLPDASDLTD